MYHLSQGKRVNLPYLIIQHMISAIQANKSSGGLPYSMILTKIFKDPNILLEGEKFRGATNSFSTKNVSHMKRNNFPGALVLNDLPVAMEEILEEEENHLLNIVNVIIIEDHLSTSCSKYSIIVKSIYINPPL